MGEEIPIEVHRDARRFAELAADWLVADPFSTNVIGVQLDGVLSGLRPQGDGDVWIAALRDARVVGVAMHTPPYHLFLPRLPAGVAGQIALALIDSQHAVDGVNGETTAVAEFAETWTERSGGRAVMVTAQRMYRLEELIHPRSSSGEVRRARPDDRDLLVDWFTRFHAEATPGRPGEAPASTVDRRLSGGQLWLWWDGGGPVSVAGISPAVAGVARVGPLLVKCARLEMGAHISPAQPGRVAWQRCRLSRLIRRPSNERLRLACTGGTSRPPNASSW